MRRRLIVVLVAGTIGLAVTGCSKSPESTVADFYQSLGKGDINTAKSFLSSQITASFGDAKINAALASEAQHITACGGIKNVQVSMNGEGDVRTGDAVVTYGGSCPQKSEKTNLIKENGKWKITANK